MRVFDLEIADEHLRAIASHGEREFPNEACGLAFGAGAATTGVFPLVNMQDRYHAMDPVQFPRTARDAFRVDELARLKLTRAEEALGHVERVVYHSHCDAGAYFSPEDRAMAVRDGMEMTPGAIHIVVSIRGGRAVDMAAYRFVPERRSFAEHRLDALFPGSDAVRDRNMPARESGAAQPYGGLLMPLRVSDAEAHDAIAASTSTLELDPIEASTLAHLGDGLYSPARGYGDEGGPELVRASIVSGTLLLQSATAQPLGVLRVTGTRPAPRGHALLGRVRVFGPEGGPGEGGPETRAELIRRGWRRVRAVMPEALAMPNDRWLDGVDGLLLPAPVAGLDTCIVCPPLLAGGLTGWRFAQNLGATHIVDRQPRAGFALIFG